MTREKEINIASLKYIEENLIDGIVAISDHKESFIEGAEWADSNPKSPWISVDDDLPCNPKYLKQEELSPWVIVIAEEGEIFFAQMMLMRGKWTWHSHFSRKHNNIRYWMPIIIPEGFEDIWEIKLKEKI